MSHYSKKKKVLLTGAFGNIGRNTLEELLRQKHRVKCFDIDTPENRKIAAKYPVPVAWGDIRDKKAIDKVCCQYIDTIIHLAAIIPPLSEKNPVLSHEVNVRGTYHLIEAAERCGAEFILASSIAVVGSSGEYPKTSESPVKPSTFYSAHKADCEDMVQESGLNWTVLRFGAVPAISFDKIDPIMFKVPLNTRIEFLHPKDAGLAVANAVVHDDAREKVLMIGGGKDCQLTYAQYLGGLLDAMGVGMFPEMYFGNKPYYTDWMDTSESQEILSYQRHNFDDFLKEMPKRLGWKRYAIRLFKPFVRDYVLKKAQVKIP